MALEFGVECQMKKGRLRKTRERKSEEKCMRVRLSKMGEISKMYSVDQGGLLALVTLPLNWWIGGVCEADVTAIAQCW